jgi:hypothetical protein
MLPPNINTPKNDSSASQASLLARRRCLTRPRCSGDRSPTHVGQLARKLDRVDELGARREPALDAERQHRAVL